MFLSSRDWLPFPGCRFSSRIGPIPGVSILFTSCFSPLIPLFHLLFRLPAAIPALIPPSPGHLRGRFRSRSSYSYAKLHQNYPVKEIYMLNNANFRAILHTFSPINIILSLFKSRQHADYHSVAPLLRFFVILCENFPITPAKCHRTRLPSYHSATPARTLRRGKAGGERRS